MIQNDGEFDTSRVTTDLEKLSQRWMINGVEDFRFCGHLIKG